MLLLTLLLTYYITGSVVLHFYAAHLLCYQFSARVTLYFTSLTVPLTMLLAHFVLHFFDYAAHCVTGSVLASLRTSLL